MDALFDKTERHLELDIELGEADEVFHKLEMIHEQVIDYLRKHDS